jgi:hypothetical protein
MLNRLRLSICGTALVAVLAACAAHAGPPHVTRVPPPTFQGTTSIRWIDWSSRVAVRWPITAKRRQLVIAPAWKADEFLGFYIADGRQIVSVLRTDTRGELSAMLADFAFQTAGTPGDSISWGIAGAVAAPKLPPPPPEPGGLPAIYVNHVLNAAGRLDESVLVREL